MINTVRIWTRKPSRVFFAAIERSEEVPAPKPVAEEKVGFFGSYVKMWERQIDLLVRNISE